MYSVKKAWQWRCSASARPTFQSSDAVYNHARWSGITTGFLWVVYFNNRQQTTVMLIMTKICHSQNPPSKQHLNGCQHYRSIVWAQANRCASESSKRSQNLKHNVVENKLIESENLCIKPHICLIKIKPHFSGTHLMINSPHLGRPLALWYPPLFSHDWGLRNSLLKSY